MRKYLKSMQAAAAFTYVPGAELEAGPDTSLFYLLNLSVLRGIPCVAWLHGTSFTNGLS